MGAESQVPATPFPGKGFFTQMINDVNLCVSMGVVSATSETVASLLTNLAAEQGKR